MISGSVRCMPNSEALSRSRRAAVSSLFGHTSSRETGVGQVSSRSGHQETDRESVATTLFILQSRGKRDQEFNFVHALWDRDNLQHFLERKVDLAIQGEKEAQRSSIFVSGWGGDWGEELGIAKSGLIFARNQSRIWISAIWIESSKPMGWSGSERQN